MPPEDSNRADTTGLSENADKFKSTSGYEYSGSQSSTASAGNAGISPNSRPDSARSDSVRSTVEQLVKQGLQDLERQKRTLQREVDQLERRKERLEGEMRSSFAGASQDIAIRVQGFKNYLVGSLQDLVSAAEEMDLMPSAPVAAVEPAASAAASRDRAGAFGRSAVCTTARSHQQSARSVSYSARLLWPALAAASHL